MKFNCQLNVVTYGNCVQITSIVLNTLFLIGLSVYMYFFYWIIRIMTVIIKLIKFSQLTDKGLIIINIKKVNFSRFRGKFHLKSKKNTPFSYNIRF